MYNTALLTFTVLSILSGVATFIAAAAVYATSPQYPETETVLHQNIKFAFGLSKDITLVLLAITFILVMLG